MQRTDCGNIAAAMSGKDREFAVANMCTSGALHSFYDPHALGHPHALYDSHAFHDPHALHDPHNLRNLRAVLALAHNLKSIVN